MSALRRTYSILAASCMLGTPFVALAQGLVTTTGQSFRDLVGILISFLDQVVIVLGAFVVLLFFVGVVRYMTAIDDQKARAKSKNFIIWSLVTIFILTSLWGLIELGCASWLQLQCFITNNMYGGPFNP